MHLLDETWAVRVRRRVSLIGVLGIAAALGLLPLAPAAAAAGVTMEAHVMLGGNTRLSAWTAITVDLANDGPAVNGELRLTGGNQGRTRYAVPVELPTGSNKRVTMYAQPSPFRSTFDLSLVADDGSQVAATSLKIVNHDAYSPLVAVMAERPQGLVPGVQAAVNDNVQSAPASIITLGPADLPDRVEGWGPLDRLVWQDVAADELTPDQLTALRGWVAGGGRLVLVGGTSGSGFLAALPDDLLPYRPTTTADVDTAELSALLGELPAGATALPAAAGVLSRGRVLLRAGELVAAAAIDYGRGSVVLVGVDPATPWLADSGAGARLWRVALPTGPGGGSRVNPTTLFDDSQLVQALYALPTLELPPIDLLIGLLVVYTLLIGPLDYLVLKRLDRRELAWVTMPILVFVFSVASYGVGLSLHGADTIVNELAVVSGSAGTDAGRAQVYFGLFSPSRRSFDVELDGPVLVTSPISEFQQTPTTQAGLDVVQGERARVRALEVGVSDLRTFRGELAAPAPLVEADLRLEGATIRGTVVNRSTRTLENAAVAYGSSLAKLGDLPAGASADVSLGVGSTVYASLAEQLFGAYAGPGARSAFVRRAMLDQVTQGNGKFPTAGPWTDRPVLIAFDSAPVVPVALGAERPQQVADTMYALQLTLHASGSIVLTSALVSHQIVDSDAAWASDDGSGFSLGEGTMTIAFQGIPLDGPFHATRLVVAMGGNGEFIPPPPQAPPLPTATPEEVAGDLLPAAAVPAPGIDQLVPTFELFDRVAGTWVAFQPLAMGASAEIGDAERYVDDNASVLVRFTFDDPFDQGNQAYFNLGLRIEGTVE